MEHHHNLNVEQDVTIPIPETEMQIHGVLRGGYNRPFAILAPGLGGWMHDLIIYNASRHFEEHGIATLRVSFYGDDVKQRNIGDFDVKTNAQDIDTIVEYVKAQGADWVCVVGHSYSGMAIVYSNNQSFDAAVLWDPSHTGGYDEPEAKQNLSRDFVYVPELNSYISANGPGYVLSRKVFENYAPGSTAMAKDFHINTLVVNADGSGPAMHRFGEDYTSSIAASTKHIVIPDATHPFTENGAMERLYDVTLQWLYDQISKRYKKDEIHHDT